MKKTILIIFCVGVVLSSFGQSSYLGADRQQVRLLEKNKDDIFLESTIANSGEFMDTYIIDTNRTIEIAFYYNIRDTCNRIKFVMRREVAVKFIGLRFADYKRLSDKMWMSNDGLIACILTVDSDGFFEFDFKRIADINKYSHTN